VRGCGLRKVTAFQFSFTGGNRLIGRERGEDDEGVRGWGWDTVGNVGRRGA
jgi:hypothetical protein